MEGGERHGDHVLGQRELAQEERLAVLVHVLAFRRLHEDGLVAREAVEGDVGPQHVGRVLEALVLGDEVPRVGHRALAVLPSPQHL